MFKIVIACVLVASAAADVSHLLKSRQFSPLVFASRPQVAVPLPVARSAGHEVAILRQTNDAQPDGSYEWGFEAENGIAAQEHGAVHQVGPEQIEKVAQGSFSWTSPEGEPISVSYTADANGYQPQGSHIPVPPPVPQAIQRALEYIAAHPQREEPSYSSGVELNRRF